MRACSHSEYDEVAEGATSGRGGGGGGTGRIGGARAAGSGTREAALSAAVAACKQMSFDAFVRHDHDTQNIWDDIGEKATLNQERWNELHADSRDEVSIED